MVVSCLLHNVGEAVVALDLARAARGPLFKALILALISTSHRDQLLCTH